MKSKFKSNELAHIWAHQIAERGTCDQSKSFDGVSYYSYAAEIGRIITVNGRRAYIVSDAKHSDTTTKHQNDMMASIPSGFPIFHWNGSFDKASGPELCDYALAMAKRSAASAASARQKRGFHLSAQETWLNLAVCIVEYFGLKRKLDLTPLESLQSEIVTERANQERRNQESNARELVKSEQDIRQWIAGGNIRISHKVSKTFVRSVGSNLETSKGATVPLMDAQKAFRFATSKRKKGWRRNGETFAVGNYQLDFVTAEGIIAGCHRIGWDEVERFAKTQNWINA